MGYGIAYRTIQRIANKVFPGYFVNQLMGELIILRARLSSRKMRNKYKGRQNLKLNIGSGASAIAGWENIDVIPSAGVNCVWDCRTSLPFDANSARCIFTEHFFEHIDFYEEAPLLLKDIYRVLNKGAVVRIIIPDAQKYIEAYIKNGWEDISMVRPLLMGNVDPYTQKAMHTKMELVNEIFRQAYQHKYAYDFETLKYLLNGAGFKTVIRQEFNISLNPELLIDKSDRAPESLYVEAVKE